VDHGVSRAGRGAAAGRTPLPGGRLGRTGEQEAGEEEAGQQPGEEHEAAEETEHDRLRVDVVDDSHPLDSPVGSRPKV
jgi:hypothetical protein